MSDSNDNSLDLDSIHPESKTLREGTGFTQINNKVINNIKNGDAYLVWCYLYSKSSNWKTIKSNIKNVYGFGDVKINKIFSYLNRAKLIEYVQGKSANGTFKPVQIRILNGAKFDKTQAWTDDAPHVQKPTLAVNCTNGNDELLNKEITKDIKEQNNKYISATDVTHENQPCAFNEFWNVYPRKINKRRAKHIWDKQALNKDAERIINDVCHRLVHDGQWQELQFVPHPTTYLQYERWHDELTPQKTTKASKSDGNESLTRLINKHTTKGNVYDHSTGKAIDPLR